MSAVTNLCFRNRVSSVNKSSCMVGPVDVFADASKKLRVIFLSDCPPFAEHGETGSSLRWSLFDPCHVPNCFVFLHECSILFALYGFTS